MMEIHTRTSATTCLRLLIVISGFAALNAFWTRNGFYRRACYDVAIVGGGIGGTYTAWRLRNQGLKVAIFEDTDRIGGRTFSAFLPSVPDIPLDLGAMRYFPGVHTTLERTVAELGLQTKIFQPDQFDRLYYIRGRRLRPDDLTTDKLPYNLAPGESRDPDVLKWTLSQRALNVSEPDKIPDIEEFATPDGVPVYKQGYLSLLENIWSPEAKAYLMQRSNFRLTYEPNMNAVHSIVASNPSNPKIVRWTVVGGMNGVAKRLAEQFLAASTSHAITTNRRVDAIRKTWRNDRYVYELDVYVTQTVHGYTSDTWDFPKAVCADKVILAIPTPALKKIQWHPLQRSAAMRDVYNALTDYTALKIFLAYPYAWWDRLPQNRFKAFETDNPLRQGGEFGRFRNSSGHETAVLMACYTDGETEVDYWRELRKFPSAFPFSNVPDAFSVSERVLQHAHHHLGAVYGINPADIPRPLDGVMTIWDEYTHVAWQRYNPGYQPKTLARITRNLVPGENVFIVTNSYSKSFSVWTEGSLRAADSVLSDFFNI